MKKFILFLALLLFAVNSWAQVLSTQPLPKDYLQGSNKQKTIAWIILGTGLGVAATGGIIQLVNNKKPSTTGGIEFDFTGMWIAIAGGVICLASIPFFIGSGRDSREAMILSLNTQQFLFPQENSLVLTSHPSLSLKISF